MRTAELIKKILGFTPLMNKIFLNKNSTSIKQNLSIETIINYLAYRVK